MEHLALEVFDRQGLNGQFANLPASATITLIMESPLFGSGNIWSLPFTLNVNANLHLFKSAGEVHGARLHDQLDKRRARLWVSGLPLYYGYIELDSEVSVTKDGDVDIVFSSGRKTFMERIEGGKANQVPLLSDVLLGVALWRQRSVQVDAELQVTPVLEDDSDGSDNYDAKWAPVAKYMTKNGSNNTIALTSDICQLWPKYMMPHGIFWNKDMTGVAHTITKEDTINTQEPYDDEAPTAHPYCNVALCYQKHGFPKVDDGTALTADAGSGEENYSSDPVAQRGYDVAPADRVNTAPCFYVMYWLRALFTHLGMPIDENQMQDVQDLRRLFFVNTKCAYEEPASSVDNDERYQWCSMAALTTKYPVAGGRGVAYASYIPEDRVREEFIKVEDSRFQVTNHDVPPVDTSQTSTGEPGWMVQHYGDPTKHIKGFKVTIQSLKRPKDWFSQSHKSNTTIFYPQGLLRFVGADGVSYGFRGHKAYATSDNFPDVDIEEVVKALEDGFGVRFVFDESYHRVKIVLMRNVLRSNAVQKVACKVVGKAELSDSNIRGFRMTYGGSDDTAFCYKPFQEALPSGAKKKEWIDKSDTHDYSKMKLNSSYTEAKNNVTAFNKTCYVDPVDGNTYGVKVDKDAKRYNEQYPSLFEFAGYMDAEDGVCNDDNEGSVKEISLGFAPAFMNDVAGNAEGTDQSFALMVDGDMGPRRFDFENIDCSAPDCLYPVTELHEEPYVNLVDPSNSPKRGYKSAKHEKLGAFSITSDMYAQVEMAAATLEFIHYLPGVGGPRTVSVNAHFDLEGYVNEGYKLFLQDNFEPNDDGVAPIETHDWGLTLGVMRGSGSDSKVSYSLDSKENEDNDTWKVVDGSSATAHPDTCNDYGEQWDYNGSQGGVGDLKGRFSLKLRAEKPNPYFDPSQPESAQNRRYLEITDPNNRRRGLMDKFHAEESYWWRNARVAKQTCQMEIATLKAMDLTVRAQIGDINGFIKRMTVVVSNETGIGMVEVEQMYL